MGIHKWIPKSIRRRADDWPEFGMDRFMGDSFPAPGRPSQGRSLFEAWSPEIDVSERQDEVVVRADLPGLERDDVEVNVTDEALTLRGERRTSETVEEEDYYRSERWAGAFARTLPLPSHVAPEKAEASFKNGVLEVHLPKSADPKRRRITIQP